MKYKGIELTEITTPNIDNLPKKMLVWNDYFNNPIERVVCAVAVDNCGGLFFIVRNEDEQLKGITPLLHCAEIPEEPKPRRATNRELAKWLAQGNGEFTAAKAASYSNYSSFSYEECNKDEEVYASFKVRKWSDTDWHEPDVKYMGIE